MTEYAFIRYLTPPNEDITRDLDSILDIEKQIQKLIDQKAAIEVRLPDKLKYYWSESEIIETKNKQQEKRISDYAYHIKRGFNVYDIQRANDWYEMNKHADFLALERYVQEYIIKNLGCKDFEENLNIFLSDMTG